MTMLASVDVDLSQPNPMASTKMSATMIVLTWLAYLELGTIGGKLIIDEALEVHAYGS